MKLKSCPLCGHPGSAFDTGKFGCARSNCLLLTDSAKAWNRLPRRDPLARQKEAVVKAAMDWAKGDFGFEKVDRWHEGLGEAVYALLCVRQSTRRSKV